MVSMLIITACPRPKPKSGTRSDARAAKLNEYLALELDPARDEWQKPEKIIEMLSVSKGDKVAVTFAGAGYFTMKLSEAVGSGGMVYASDPDEQILNLLNDKIKQAGAINVQTILSKPDDPQIPYGSVDIAFVVNTLPYVDLPYAFFDNVRRGIKSGGRLVVIDWRKGSKMGPKSKLRRSRGDVKKILLGMDLEFIAEHDILPYQYILVFKVVKRYG